MRQKKKSCWYTVEINWNSEIAHSKVHKNRKKWITVSNLNRTINQSLQPCSFVYCKKISLDTQLKFQQVPTFNDGLLWRFRIWGAAESCQVLWYFTIQEPSCFLHYCFASDSYYLPILEPLSMSNMRGVMYDVTPSTSLNLKVCTQVIMFLVRKSSQSSKPYRNTDLVLMIQQHASIFFNHNFWTDYKSE